MKIGYIVQIYQHPLFLGNIGGIVYISLWNQNS